MVFFSMIKILLLCSASLSVLLATPASGQSFNHLLDGQRLNTGQSLRQGSYGFIIQEDCNLVLYNHGVAKWASGSYHKGSGCYLTMQSDGNLVVYDNRNRAVWASGTDRGNGNYILIVQRDGNVVIYAQPIWATGTNNYGSAGVVIAAARNGTVGASGAEQNKLREMGRIVQVLSAE